jgi:Kef-type K+ transport system membrane component KefB
MTSSQLALQLLFQIGVILLVAQGVGMLGARLGQPHVVAEMVAGVLLGPSLLGLFWPQLYQWLFPPQSLQILFAVSQLGLAAYMFVVGLEFRMDIVQRRLRSALAVSAAGMAVPFALGATLGWFFYRTTHFFDPRASLFESAVFLGASMCITAFPVLARIIQFKELGGTVIGTVALGAGAINDAAAWCLLAIVLASFDHNFTHALATIGGGVLYVAVTVWVIGPILSRWGKRVTVRGHLPESGLVFCLVLFVLGAWVTDLIGLHAVFGSFVMGAAMPRGLVNRSLIDRIQPLTLALLLPLYFTYSGLNTQIGLLNSPYLWLMALLVIFAAIASKGMGCWLAALLTGLPNRDALGIGMLMNVRGLMELIIINIGLQRGIISAGLFAVLVLMAVVTTLMASPLFERFVVGRAPNDNPRHQAAGSGCPS